MIKLEPFGRDDFKKLISWIDNEEMLVQFGGALFSFPLTIKQLDDYISDTNRHCYKVVEQSDLEIIGHAELVPTDEKTIKLCRILIGDETRRGRGFGKQVINELLTISFLRFGAEKVELNVYDWNEIAISCYKKVGFILNPNKTFQSEVKGDIWTAINMTITQSSWLARSH